MGFPLRTRFAPTPSGYLHLGNAWSFVLTWLAARSQNGRIHLRIDDLDTARAQTDYLEDIFISLKWLGLDWDGGPRSVAEFQTSHSQRNRISRYREVMAQARDRNLLFACACSRETVRRNAEAMGSAKLYPGTCRDLGLDPDRPEHSWRCRVGGDVKARNETGKALVIQPGKLMGDFVVRQKNGDPSYQLASIVDDEDMAINFVVRGMDLFPSTAAQLSLAHGLGFEHFPKARFWHHSLVIDDTGEKLSKSAKAESLRALRDKLGNSVPLLKMVARQLGLSSEGVKTPHDLLEGFRMERVPLEAMRVEEWQAELNPE